MLGSIGVVGIFRDYCEAETTMVVKTIEIVSSQSPWKRPDSATKPGRAAIQVIIDNTAEVFVRAVTSFGSFPLSTHSRRSATNLIRSEAVVEGLQRLKRPTAGSI